MRLTSFVSWATRREKVAEGRAVRTGERCAGSEMDAFAARTARPSTGTEGEYSFGTLHIFRSTTREV